MEQRPSIEGRKNLLKSYRGHVDEQLQRSRHIVSHRTIIRDIFKVLIAILLSSTTLTSLLQFTGKDEVYKFIIVISSVCSSVLTSIYSTLDLENIIIKNDGVALSCDSLLLEIDRFLLTSKPIDEAEIDQLILKINGIISQTSIDTMSKQAKV